MRQMLVAGNWKMNGSKAKVAELLNEVSQGCSVASDVEWVVFPPFVYLPSAQQCLESGSVLWGAQNVSEHQSGAYTGEIAASMLVDFGCEYVIVGHSERRQLYQETDAQVAAKFAAALAAGLKPVLCVGETAAQREQGDTLKIVKQQLAAVMTLHDNHPAISQAVIAYEPVWAIGTGHHATPDQAQQVHAAIRQELTRRDAQLASSVRIIYGGSVNPQNAADLFAMPDIDGALVGGAALKADSFLKIGAVCNS